MKTILRISAFMALVLLLNPTAQAQSSGYTTGIGLRGGDASGLTIKHFIDNEAAIEGIISSSFRYRGTVLTALYELHAPAFNVEGLQWYYGLGGHIGFYDGYYYYRNRGNKRYEHRDDNIFGLGIDGIVGLEYYIREIPFTIGADIKPQLNLPAGGGFWNSALHVRYVF
ncbi:hypothetical protein ACFSKU_10575 [Pontibacter silvestris]|uniref:DUF3575 domain-containing protein n=1 Tax=Pontibacter silvestris TaxID=2305183 RepID=A0ABW4WXI7_9BACT|nr:hypothetical protein [Pontibacter silvestris]MCC9136720.1 hypothetical protein [Pontibacter silvestris]